MGTPQHESLATRIDRRKMGSWRLGSLLTSSVTPFVVTAGLFTSAYAATGGLRSLPLALLIVAGVLALFLVGYLSMAAHMTENGGFYVYVSRGLGAGWGIIAATVVAWAYCELQTALYGLFGVSMQAMAETNFPGPLRHLTWWQWAGLLCLAVAVLGVARLDIGASLLSVFAAGEMVTNIVLSVRGLMHPTGGGRVTLEVFNPLAIATAGVAALAMFSIASLSYVGVEQAGIYSAAVRTPQGRPRHVVLARASYGVLAITTVVYVLASFALQVFYGDQLATEAANGPGALFAMAGTGTLASFAQAQLLISAGAAAVAFHNATARYLFHLGRARILFAWLGHANALEAPYTASLTQSVIGFISIAVVTVGGFDPLFHMFYGLGNAGAVGVLLVMVICSVAVFAWFHRNPTGESAWRRRVAPGVAAVALGVMLVLVAYSFPTLFNQPRSSPVPWLWLASLSIPIVAALLRIGYLRARRRRAVWDGLMHRQATPPADGPTRVPAGAR